ncbi:MmgE/PrpD family protein [Neopoerus faecalis]|uniref:MmgE/PrpD family protein n=1 Tax=Neopoerus faecalis TaxID=3032125 RepID=UPI00256FDADE|nr:MmgE/PrpD family protein [Neopoerus faecalis]
MTLAEKLVKPIYRMTYKELPAEVIEKVKLCLLHSLACAYVGIDERWSKAAREMTATLHPAGNASIWFSTRKSNMADAAFVNAVYAQSILYEDIHRDSNAHPGVVIIPTALAVAEETGAPMTEVVTAIVAGYEMMARIGRGTACPEFGSRGFRPTSIIGTFGSCMTAGRLLGLTYEQQLTAFALSASFTAGINQWAIEGTDDLYFQNGTAARGGIVAAQLAKRGVMAPAKIVEGDAGICAAFGLSQANLESLDCEDGHYSILDVLFKPAPACALVQTTAQAAIDAVRQGIQPADIVSGVIYTFQLGKTYAGCDNPGPFDALLQARMSNHFNFAASMVHQRIANANYYDFKNPEVTRLAGVLKLEVDPEYTGKFPVKQPVRVELELRNGETRTIYREEPVYLQPEDNIAKLDEHCSADLGELRLARIVDMIMKLDQLKTPGELLDLFIKESDHGKL